MQISPRPATFTKIRCLRENTWLELICPMLPAWKFYGSCGGAGCKNQIPDESFLYYPGMHNRADALLITIGKDEKRDDIDFTVPTL